MDLENGYGAEPESAAGGGLAWTAVRAMAEAAEAMRDTGDFSALAARLPLGKWFAS